MLSRSRARSRYLQGYPPLRSRSTLFRKRNARSAAMVSGLESSSWVSRIVGVAMITGLRRFYRLVAEPGENEAIRLVKKRLVRGHGAAKYLCPGQVLKTAQKKQSQSHAGTAEHKSNDSRRSYFSW